MVDNFPNDFIGLIMKAYKLAFFYLYT